MVLFQVKREIHGYPPTDIHVQVVISHVEHQPTWARGLPTSLLYQPAPCPGSIYLIDIIV